MVPDEGSSRGVSETGDLGLGLGRSERSDLRWDLRRGLLRGDLKGGTRGGGPEREDMGWGRGTLTALSSVFNISLFHRFGRTVSLTSAAVGEGDARLPQRSPAIT